MPKRTKKAPVEDVLEYSSPDGQRIALVDTLSGDVWMVKRLSPADASGTLAMLHLWSRVSEDSSGEVAHA